MLVKDVFTRQTVDLENITREKNLNYICSIRLEKILIALYDHLLNMQLQQETHNLLKHIERIEGAHASAIRMGAEPKGFQEKKEKKETGT